ASPAEVVKQLSINFYTGTITVAANMKLAVSNWTGNNYLGSFMYGGTINLNAGSTLEVSKVVRMNFGDVNINAVGGYTNQTVLFDTGANVSFEQMVEGRNT